MKYAFVLVIVLASCAQKKSFPDTTEREPSDSLFNFSMETRRIKAADLKTGPGFSTPVISNAQKFIIPVPAFQEAGEPLIYPQSHPKAGQPIVDYKGNSVGRAGIVFFNAKDQTWQAAVGDGQSVIIINEVAQQQAEMLHQEIEKYHSDPAELTLQELKQVVSFAQEQLHLDDMYNSTRAYVREKMTAVLPPNGSQNGLKKDQEYGFKQRNNRDINQAIYIPGEFVFEGPAATPQKFKNGGVIVEQGGKMRGVQPDIFVRTYQLGNGRPINSVTKDIEAQHQ